MHPHPHPVQRRPPAAAGLFYPAERPQLRAQVDALLEGADPPAAGSPVPKAVIVPHAGYEYSGPVAASGFVRLAPASGRVERVVLVGPAHREAFAGVAAPAADWLSTPLGDVAIDGVSLQRLPSVSRSERAHAREHSLEVELPFLQRVLPGTRVVPLLVGSASPAEVGQILDALWGGDETIVVISSDLSHYLPYGEARSLDRETARLITSLQAPPLSPERACGARPIDGLLWLAQRRPLQAHLLDLRSSGDTAGDRDSVVGYGAFAFFEAAPRA